MLDAVARLGLQGGGAKDESAVDILFLTVELLDQRVAEGVGEVEA